MSTANQKRSRSARGVALPLPPGQLNRLLRQLQRGDVLLRLGMCCLAAVLMWLATTAWAPPFAFRSGDIPTRNVVARIEFSRPDPERTEDERKKRIAATICVYRHDVQPLVELREALKDQIFQVVRAPSYQEMDPKVWRRFVPDDSQRATVDDEQLFNDFRTALQQDMDQSQLETAVQRAFEPFEKKGLLENLEHQLEQGSQTTLRVHPLGDERLTQRVEVAEVRIAEVSGGLEARLASELKAIKVPDEKVELTARLINSWVIAQKLPTTLTLNRNATQAAYDEALANMPEATIVYPPGVKLADGGKPLVPEDIELLRREHRTFMSQLTWLQMLRHTLANLGMYVALYVLCGAYIFYHAQPLMTDLRRLATMLLLVVVTVGLCNLVAREQWRAEMIPLILFGMIVAIAYHRELALLLSATVALAVTLTAGQGLSEFVILMAAVSSAILMMGRVRSRTRLIYVGAVAGFATVLTTVGVGTMAGQTFGASDMTEWLTRVGWTGHLAFVARVSAGAAWYGFCALLAAFMMTGLLPFIERMFDVQTDISLLELGDAAHPLLQELARRAPGTYNHSINVASLGEAAAESIGANGLLVRVGAYFHDIGKMLKPGYFIENQGPTSRHESLLPAMSTLVIIAHVKDGVDLARQYHLPRSIIDFIEQHHGTTLVEYFYRQEERRQEEGPDHGEVDETNFRYPGPKPQTREAGVMMLSDAVESASRTLVDPAPARIESLVHELAMKRLLDGQFDECGLTLKEMNTIEDSLVKSLTAVYHGRVKYPDQQTA